MTGIRVQEGGQVESIVTDPEKMAEELHSGWAVIFVWKQSDEAVGDAVLESFAEPLISTKVRPPYLNFVAESCESSSPLSCWAGWLTVSGMGSWRSRRNGHFDGLFR